MTTETLLPPHPCIQWYAKNEPNLPSYKNIQWIKQSEIQKGNFSIHCMIQDIDLGRVLGTIRKRIRTIPKTNLNRTELEKIYDDIETKCTITKYSRDLCNRIVIFNEVVRHVTIINPDAKMLYREGFKNWEMARMRTNNSHAADIASTVGIVVGSVFEFVAGGMVKLG